MKAEYINPFITAVFELFSTMMGCEAKRGQIAIAKDGAGSKEITALIGLGGQARGSVSISLPYETARGMVAQMLGVDGELEEDTLVDGVAELVNIVAGSAKAKFCQDGGTPLDLSLPTVIRGEGFQIDYPSKTVWIEVPFSSELGPFKVRVTFEDDIQIAEND
jgi:chemotaxis protein CheX